MVDEGSLRSTEDQSSWFKAVQRILDELDERARIILTERVLGTAGSIPTLQDLGDQFKVSRERVRQIEEATVKALRRDATTTSELASAVSFIRDDLGLVFSLHDLAEALVVDLDPQAPSIEVKVLLFLAGPYHLGGELIVSSKLDPALADVLNQVAAGPVLLTSVRSEMQSLGIRESVQVQVLRTRRGIRILGEMVVPWTGTIGDKAALLLMINQRIMDAEELHDQLGEGTLTTLKNYLGADERFQRRGRHRWGLSEWGGETYKSISAEMTDELRGLPDGMPIDRLKRILHDKFRTVEASVEIMSVTHPSFVRDGAWVRLRTDDEPYVPDSALEEDPNCVAVGGSWSWRHLVTHDTLRGSGHIIPEAFAAMLRLFPGNRSEVRSDFGAVLFSWPSQSPQIGSLRIAAEGLGATKPDLLFVIPEEGRIEFKLVRATDMTGASSIEELLLRLGQPNDADQWLSVLATALGLPPHANADEIEDLLEVRGDRDVLRLFHTARLEGQDG
jgi:hypothetical protein